MEHDVDNTNISIHALLAESDQYIISARCKVWISIHALLAESDENRQARRPEKYYFYPRSPCGERPFWGSDSLSSKYISIHALLAESD